LIQATASLSQPDWQDVGTVLTDLTVPGVSQMMELQASTPDSTVPSNVESILHNRS